MIKIITKNQKKFKADIERSERRAARGAHRNEDVQMQSDAHDDTEENKESELEDSEDDDHLYKLNGNFVTKREYNAAEKTSKTKR